MIASLCLWLLVRKVDVIENVVRAEAVVPLSLIHIYTGVNVAGAGTHGKTGGRGEAHGGVDALAALDRGDGGACLLYTSMA